MEQKIQTVLLKFRVNPRRMEKLRSQGVQKKHRDDEGVMLSQIIKAHDAGDEVAFGRKDATGVVRSDTGKKIFVVDLKEQVEHRPVHFTGIPEMLKRAGFYLEDVHTYHKDGDGMGFLVMSFSRNAEGNMPQDVEIVEEVEDLLTLVWDKCHVWQNPNGSMTINIAHISQSSTVHFDEVYLDFDEQGNPSFTRAPFTAE